MHERIPLPEIVIAMVASLKKLAKLDPSKKLMKGPESAFLNHFAIPILFPFISQYRGLDPENARIALLSGSFRGIRQFATHAHARPERYPLKKAPGGSPKTVIRQRKGQSAGSSLVQSRPDFAPRQPFPFRIVFEGKYLVSGGIERAASELATDFYQTLFHPGPPFVPETKLHQINRSKCRIK